MLRDTATGGGYLQALAVWRPADGLVGRLEGGYRPFERVGLFGYGELGRMGPEAGVGARWEW